MAETLAFCGECGRLVNCFRRLVNCFCRPLLAARARSFHARCRVFPSSPWQCVGLAWSGRFALWLQRGRAGLPRRWKAARWRPRRSSPRQGGRACACDFIPGTPYKLTTLKFPRTTIILHPTQPLHARLPYVLAQNLRPVPHQRDHP